jgi:hypothetical protein
MPLSIIVTLVAIACFLNGYLILRLLSRVEQLEREVDQSRQRTYLGQ